MMIDIPKVSMVCFPLLLLYIVSWCHLRFGHRSSVIGFLISFSNLLYIQNRYSRGFAAFLCLNVEHYLGLWEANVVNITERSAYCTMVFRL